MFITLGISMAVYMAVAVVAVLTVPPGELARLDAPLAEVFKRVTGAPPILITIIAIVATLNGIIVQFIMVARVLYGLASQRRLPRFLGTINPRTQTPVLATAAAIGAVLILALLFPIGELAEWTSRITLGIFVVVCVALLRIKLRRTPAPPHTFIVPMWVPVVGAVLCLVLLLVGG
jgi:amino acid transporter